MPRKQPVATASRDDGLIANIALLYYKEGLNQSEIAKRTGLSRATIVNYLRDARESGIVDIRVQGRTMSQAPEARALRDKFELDDVYIADAGTGLDGSEPDPEESLRQTARVAASAFRDIVKPGDRIGVAWGQTMKLMADNLAPEQLPGAEVCQIIGAMDTTRLLATETCAIEIASKIGAVCHTLHTPAVLSSQELAASLRQEPTIRTQLDRLGRLDCIFTSVGNLDPTGHLVTSGIVPREDLGDVVAGGGVGFVCSLFLDAQGQPLALPLNDRMIAASVSDIQSVPRKVIAVSGASKRDATLAALKGRFATHLIIDRSLAKAILADTSG